MAVVKKPYLVEQDINRGNGYVGRFRPFRGGACVTLEGPPDTEGIVKERLQKNARDPDALFALAALRVQDGKLDQGLSILDRVLRIDPRYPGAWRFKATVHRLRGDTKAAESAASMAETTEP